jgi:hypothetical protein
LRFLPIIFRLFWRWKWAQCPHQPQNVSQNFSMIVTNGKLSKKKFFDQTNSKIIFEIISIFFCPAKIQLRTSFAFQKSNHIEGGWLLTWGCWNNYFVLAIKTTFNRLCQSQRDFLFEKSAMTLTWNLKKYEKL